MNFRTAPSFSLSKSLKKSIVDMHPHNPIAPGPIYNVSGLGKREPSLSHSIGKSQRTEINHRVEQTPSPMHYQPKKPTKNSHQTMPKSSFIEIPNTNPDPACYITDEKHTTQKVLTYTLPSRYPSIMEPTNSNPGPADYQAPKPLPILCRSKNTKETLFGSASRFKQEVSENPGAGNYEITSSKLSQFDQKYSIGKAQRQSRIQCTPGPSDYHKQSFVEAALKGKIGKSLGGKIKMTLLSERTTINAFHNYFENPESQFAASRTSPKYSMGKEKREFIKPNQNPGPAEYINNDFMVKHASVATMPRSHQAEYNDSLLKPGPGTYKIEAQKSLQYSFPRSKSLAAVSNSPGVGRYQLEATKVNKGSSFGKSKRFKMDGVEAVGVGQYNLQTEKEFKGSISKSSRFKDHIYSTPGPGDYHIHSLIG